MIKITECKLYNVTVDVDNPAITVITEVWTDKEKHDASLQSEVIKTFLAQATPLMTSAPAQMQAGPVITTWAD